MEERIMITSILVGYGTLSHDVILDVLVVYHLRTKRHDMRYFVLNVSKKISTVNTWKNRWNIMLVFLCLST